MCVVTLLLLSSPETLEEALVPHYNETGRAGAGGGGQGGGSLESPPRLCGLPSPPPGGLHRALGACWRPLRLRPPWVWPRLPAWT